MSSGNEAGQAKRAGRAEERNSIEIAEKIVRGVGAAVVAGAFFIALAIYERPGPPRYQAFAVGSEIVRIDTHQGTIIACQSGQCFNIHDRGQKVAKGLAPAAPAETATTPTAEPLPPKR